MMSALGHKRKRRHDRLMSVLCPKADIRADVVGYSRLMAANEAVTVERE
jgi:hypothetical protein